MPEIIVPQLGESVVEARVARWLKRLGEPVAAGEPIVELETDKIDLEVGSDQPGVLARIDRHDGEDVKVGEVLGSVDAGSAQAAGAASAAAAAAGPKPEAPAAQAAPRTPSAPVAAPAAAAGADLRVTATARRMAEEHGLDLARVSGSGAGGRVTKEDVQKAVLTRSETGDQRPETGGVERAPQDVQRRVPGDRSEERVRMSKRRATIARRLVDAQREAAMLTTFNEVDMSAVMALRARRKEAFQKRYGVNLGLSSFFVKASVGALRAFPRLNAEVQGDEMVLKRYYDIGIAVGATQGLVVPVIRDADALSFAQIEHAVRDFAKRAEDGSLTLEELKGGTFTITNGGVFGSLLSTPILNPPQVGILGLHKIEERPVAVSGQVVVRAMMYVALSYDHRIVDGLEAVQFLVRVKELIEDPGQMLIEL